MRADMKIVLAMLMFAVLGSSPVAEMASENNECLCKFIAPEYPRIARTAGIQGIVHLKARLDPTGKVNGVDVVDFAHPILRERAEKSIMGWMFCSLPGDRAEREVVVTFEFKLREPATQAWAPTDVTFEPPATVRIEVPSAATLQFESSREIN
jgi:TonB family protein